MRADAAGSGPSPFAVIRCDTQGDDTMHPERVGGRFVAAVLLLAIAGSAAFAQETQDLSLQGG